MNDDLNVTQDSSSMPPPRDPSGSSAGGSSGGGSSGGVSSGGDGNQGGHQGGGSTDDQARQMLARVHLALPANRARLRSKPTPQAAFDRSPRQETRRTTVGSGYTAVKSRLHERLLDEIDEEDLLDAEEGVLSEYVRQWVQRVLDREDLPLNASERSRLADDLLQETLGVGPLAVLMTDPAVTDILVNGPDAVYVERFGRLERTTIRFRDTEHLVRIIQRIAASVGRRVDESSPMVDARLNDGSRVNATLPPISLDGPTLSIRRFGIQRLREPDLMRLGMFDQRMSTFLSACVRSRINVLVSGGTGAGKSTLLGALCEAIQDHERIVTIEDAAELMLHQEHVVRLETRPPNIEGSGRISTRELVTNSLRMRPDRIIVGEVRGSEALDMLQAMNTGHDGSLTTVHSNSPRDALSRLETMVLMAGTELPSRAIREQIVSAIQLVVHVRRYEDGVRRVESVAEITGLEGETPLTQDIFGFKRTGKRGRTIQGEFRTTGIVPRVIEVMQDRGVNVSADLFQPEGMA